MTPTERECRFEWIEAAIKQILRNHAAFASALGTLLCEGEATDSQIASIENILKVMQETAAIEGVTAETSKSP